MLLKSAFLICYAIASVLGNKHVKLENGNYDNQERQSRVSNFAQRIQKVESKIQDSGNVDQDLDPANFNDNAQINSGSKRQARVELENFSNTGVIQEDAIKKIDNLKNKNEETDINISGVQVSSEYPTTMRPILTTERPYSQSSYDFVPVNLIPKDYKESWTPYSNRNFDYLSDVSLVPAGSNSRIQIKKGPNGKDYEYEYVYYYYDEEDESKVSASNNKQEGIRTAPPSRRGSNNGNRSKYSSVERTSTVEPVGNEIIPKNGNRGRNLGESEEISEERLPTNTRFPPRSRSNHNTGTTEITRSRGNRPRPNLDLVDSSSFRTHQEGPEFPQTLPKGPVRFLGVTPNENDEEKYVPSRENSQKVYEPAPVVESINETPLTHRRRPVTEPMIEAVFSGEKLSRPLSKSSEEKFESSSLPAPKDERPSYINSRYNLESTTEVITTDVPTTVYSTAMDKVALDLYAFLQQGRSNAIDAATEDISDSTTISDEELTTDIPTTTEIVSPTTTEILTTTTTEATTTTTTTTTTIAPTTEATSTTTQAPVGKGKFRRPGILGNTGNRNRSKSNGSSTPATEVSPTETTQKSRSRYGGSSSGGTKRSKSGTKQQVQEEKIQKDNINNVNSEKLPSGRTRYRSTVSKPIPSTTSSPGTSSTSSGNPSGVSRPSFNKININRRRGRPTTAAPTTNEDNKKDAESPSPDETQEPVTTTTKSPLRPKLPGIGNRPTRPGARVNIRRPGQSTTTTSTTEEPKVVAEEPAGEGTEEETHETPVETSPPARLTTVSPLNKLRSKNRLQVQPKSTTRAPVNSPRRSPLLPRRKITEAPIVETSQENLIPTISSEPAVIDSEVTEAVLIETSTAASTKHEETRSFNGLLAPRRRLQPRRPGQILNRE
ncbi:mucin-5AC isoform X1 [Microplitis demolitor]|uniref:mucin-5AC isoform X1 n=1 Tax=Microplitis demolitor TaxID=69319 RepID=UPI0004CDD141|nr:mucin-5AC isoform X1 [Microplitis demolitor]